MIRIDEDGYPFNNVQKNLLIKHMNNSDVLAYNKDYIASPIDSNFQILDAFKGTGVAAPHGQEALSALAGHFH